MKRHRRDLEVMSDLNLTNMIDTAFVLLIVFILVAPAMKSGLDINLPKVEGGESKPTDVNKTLTISIGKSPGAGLSEPIIVEDRRLTLDELRATIESKRMLNSKLDVVIEADRTSTYDTFAQVLSVLKALNIENIGLITDPVEAAPPDDKAEAKTKNKKRVSF
jgi:biopolymer transport protein ExbD